MSSFTASCFPWKNLTYMVEAIPAMVARRIALDLGMVLVFLGTVAGGPRMVLVVLGMVLVILGMARKIVLDLGMEMVAGGPGDGSGGPFW